MDFIIELFDTSDFPARWRCGLWTSGHGWLHIISDLGIWSAYFAIPLVLGYFVSRRNDLPFRRLLALFGSFILLCGTRIWFAAYPTPLHDAEGRQVGGINMLVDITERKQAENELRRLAAELTDVDRRKDEFLATLAHELRNPLAPSRGQKRRCRYGKRIYRAITS